MAGLKGCRVGEQKLLQNDVERDDRRERMQRIRVGLTGLAVVLLIVLLSTIVFTRINNQVPTANMAAAQKSNEEPLSDLGVAPRAPENATTSVPPPNKVPQRRP
jgi:hypothetical protein